MKVKRIKTFSFRLFLRMVIFAVLTILTQIGGLVYLLSLATYRYIEAKTDTLLAKAGMKLLSFVLLYVVFTLAVVPPLAVSFGRVPLPWKETSHLRPLNVLTCMLNRHYVKEDLKLVTERVAEQMNHRFPGTVVNYLDANFPFIDKFPLFPHLSHNDGKKLDLAFLYMHRATGIPVHDAPSSIGYGVCELPNGNEVNIARICADKGYWQYSITARLFPQGDMERYAFDEQRTKALVNLLVKEEVVGKLFIEPHLVERMDLQSIKVKFHGCHAVRHDDHIHIQLK